MTNQMPELNPCPFCGGEAIIVEGFGQEHGHLFYAECNAPYGKFPCNAAQFASEKNLAIAAWNIRADLAQNTVTREELDKIVYEKAEEWHNTSGNKWSIEHYIVDYLVTTGIVKISD